MSNTLTFILTLFFSFFTTNSQWQINNFKEIDDVCPYSIAGHASVFHNSSFVFVFPGENTENGKWLTQSLVMNPNNYAFTYSVDFSISDTSASQLTNSVCAFGNNNIAIWWGKKASLFNVKTLESTKLGSPTNNGYPSSMACYVSDKQLWVMQKDAHKVFTYYDNEDKWETQKLTNNYDHKYSPCTFYNSTLICAGGESNTKIEYVDINHYQGWSVSQNEIGLGDYDYYYGSTHVLIDTLWYLLGGEVAKETLTSDIWIIDMHVLLTEGANILTKSHVSLAVPVYFTSAVYDTVTHQVLVIGGTTKSDDGSQIIQVSSFFTNDPTKTPSTSPSQRPTQTPSQTPTEATITVSPTKMNFFPSTNPSTAPTESPFALNYTNFSSSLPTLSPNFSQQKGNNGNNSSMSGLGIGFIVGGSFCVVVICGFLAFKWYEKRLEHRQLK